jgi:cyclase
MLKKRIIPCLDIKEGRTVKGVNFIGLRDAGDPVDLARKYAEQGADELVFLDITATVDKRKTLCGLVERIANEINIPFTVGGGINSLEDVKAIISSGADKVSINSAAVKRPALISEIAAAYGSQCVVLAIDTILTNNQWQVVINGGTKPVGIGALHWALEVEKLGAGEILLTSMMHDGTKSGFAIDLINHLQSDLQIPIIASGGAGNQEHFYELFSQTGASAALAASIFHYGEVSIPQLKNFLKTKEIPIR